MSAQNTPPLNYDLKQAKEEAVKLLLRPNRNVVGIGIGKKVTAGNVTPQDCVRIYVVSKYCLNDLPPNSLVPSSVLNVPTDVIEVGRFGRTARPKPRTDATPRPGSPIRVKTLAPNVNEGQRGTLGAVVTDGSHQYILSCNHILSVNGRVPKGADVVSAEFVGEEKPLADAAAFIPLQRHSANSVDCAIARLRYPTLVSPAFATDTLTLSPGAAVDPLREMPVRKVGATTGATEGKIVDVDADLYLDYSFGTFLFTNQIVMDSGYNDKYFAAAGDSGSVVVDTAAGHAAALIYGASGRFAVACPLGTALDLLAKQLNVASLSLVV